MEIDHIPEWQLGHRDERSISTLLADCFATDFGGRSFFVQRPHLRLIKRDGGVIAGHMALVFRDVRQGGNVVPICGLADVACARSHRGQGTASALLHEAIAVARKSDATFILLFGNAKLYAANGFQPMPNTVHFAEMGPAQRTQMAQDSAPHLMVLNLGNHQWDANSDVDLMGHMF